MQLLNNDSASSSARPGAQAPSKLAAPPATRSDPGVWANFWRQQEGQPPLQALQAQQAQQAQQASGKVAAQSPVQPPRGKPPSPVPPLPAEAALSSLQAAAAAQQQQQQQQGTAEPGPHQAGRTSPVAGKQRSLEAMLERHVAAEAAGAAGKADAAGPADAAGAAHGEAALAVRQRQQLVDQWQGMTLSQVRGWVAGWACRGMDGGQALVEVPIGYRYVLVTRSMAVIARLLRAPCRWMPLCWRPSPGPSRKS